MSSSLSSPVLDRMDAWWRAANYLSVGQIYLMANPLLREPLSIEQVKPRLLGHWGTTPGLNFLYVHLNRVIVERDLDIIYVTGPGHGGPGLVANTWLEGAYSEFYPEVSQDEQGMRRLFRQFSFPGGIPSHCAPETPGSIHEGGELGYCLAHAFGAAFDNPDLLVACVVGDGEAETGPLAASWHSNKFLNPARDGAVLPVLQLNGWKIANPTLLARMSDEELEHLFRGYGYAPRLVAGDDPRALHPLMAETLDTVLDEIREIQQNARRRGFTARPPWPMIVLRTPKGWTGPKEVDGLPMEGTWRAHQVPLAGLREKPEHLEILESWMRSYRPEEIFDADGRPVAEIVGLAPHGDRRMGANPHANGGLLLRALRVPDFRDYAVEVPEPGAVVGEATRVLGGLLRDVMKRNLEARNFRVFGPDETASNRLGALFEVTDKAFTGPFQAVDEHLSADGRVLEVLSEHLCQGWLEGYLLTGRHGFFSCYEAFIHIVDSMFNQHAKWLKVSHEIPWRRPIASLNYLLTSHVWRQDHNGFSHQDPGFIDHVVNKKADVIRVYLPPDANTLLVVPDECLRSRDRINVIVAGKQPQVQFLDMESAIPHCAAGVGIWEWASNDRGEEPDVVMALRGRRPDARDPGRGVDAPRALPGASSARRERGRPDDATARERAPRWAPGPRLRHDLHQGEAHHLRLSRLPLADPSSDLPAHQPPQPPRARLQGGRNHHDPLRHGGAQRPRSLPPGRGRDRPRAEARPRRRLRQASHTRQADRARRVYPRARRGPAGDPQLALEGGRGRVTGRHGARLSVFERR